MQLAFMIYWSFWCFHFEGLLSSFIYHCLCFYFFLLNFGSWKFLRKLRYYLLLILGKINTIKITLREMSFVLGVVFSKCTLEYINHLSSFVVLLMGIKVCGVTSCMLLIFNCVMMIYVIAVVLSFGVSTVCVEWLSICLLSYSPHCVVEYLVGIGKIDLLGIDGLKEDVWSWSFSNCYL